MKSLYGRSSNGKIKVWKITVNGNKITTVHGFQGGSMQEDITIVHKGKNLGKVNETTPEEQATIVANTKWNLKYDKGYRETVEDILVNNLPMLAKDFNKMKHKVVYPAFLQPKLNGIRCIAKRISDTEVTYTSRKGKTFDTLDHLTPHLCSVMNIGESFDGEIYIHGQTFQSIIRLLKKYRPGETEKLEYWIYDVAIPDVPFNKRHERLLKMDPNDHLRYVHTKVVNTENAIKELHDAYVRKDYEGVIVRNTDGLYKFDHRSTDLQKYKEFIDEEFEIVDFKVPDTGREENCIVFKVQTADGNIFEARPRGSHEQRRAWAKDFESFKGKKLTVRYQELSEDGIPIFPVGITIRDYE